jgi:hypothetical protein
MDRRRLWRIRRGDTGALLDVEGCFRLLFVSLRVWVVTIRGVVDLYAQ